MIKSGSSDFYFYFLPIADLKNFSSCNVIQQIKKVSPYDPMINFSIDYHDVWLLTQKA